MIAIGIRRRPPDSSGRVQSQRRSGNGHGGALLTASARCSPPVTERCRSCWMRRGRRWFSGALDSEKIRVLLISAAKDPSDPGLRAESVEIFERQRAVFRSARRAAGRAEGSERGVRLKAMSGLKSFAQQPEVRTAMTQVLLADANPEMRTQAIDLLTKGMENPVQRFDSHVIGAMQELMNRENNAYVRQRCKTALEAVKASTETY